MPGARSKTIDWSHALAVADRPADPPGEPRDFNVVVRVRNGRLLAAIRREGYASISEFARRNGLLQQEVSGLVSMRISPLSRRTGMPTPLILRVADALHAAVADLVPPRQMAAAMATASRPVGLDLTDDQIEYFLRQVPTTPEQWLALSRAQLAIKKNLGTLTPREQRVLHLHLGLDGYPDAPLREVAKQIGVGGNRVQQIERRAIRRLRHPGRAKYFIEAAEVIGFDVRPWSGPPTMPWPVPARTEPEVAAPPPHPTPAQEAQRLVRRRIFPDEPPPPDPPVLPVTELREVHIPYAVLLRTPEAARTIDEKRAIVYLLEREFGRRGAGELRINQTDECGRPRTPLAIEARKYEYLMTNLDELWRMFPPAPSEAAAD
jgi:hypothetical protein